MKCVNSLSNILSRFNKQMPIFVQIIERIDVSLDLVRFIIVDIQNGKHCESMPIMGVTSIYGLFNAMVYLMTYGNALKPTFLHCIMGRY